MQINTFLAASLVAALPVVALAQDAQSIPTNGVTYNVQTWGDPANPVVVLMHGWMGTSHKPRKPPRGSNCCCPVIGSKRVRKGRASFWTARPTLWTARPTLQPWLSVAPVGFYASAYRGGSLSGTCRLYMAR